jgi:hypothetical protein
VGNIQTNSSLSPSIDGVYDIGNPSKRYDGIYARYFYGNGAFLTGISGGNTNTGNIGFVGDAIYDLNGIIIENADLSHGATAAIILPANGNTSPIQINNIYGNVLMQAGINASVTAVWAFNNDGSTGFPGLVSAAGNVVGNNLKATGNIYIGNTVFTRTLTVGRALTPVTVPLASNNSFNVLTVGSGNVAVYTT